MACKHTDFPSIHSTVALFFAAAATLLINPIASCLAAERKFLPLSVGQQVVVTGLLQKLEIILCQVNKCYRYSTMRVSIIDDERQN
jgi:hypothetical protein